MAIILSERSVALSITKVYKERLMQNAELVAKKELVSLSTAIDSAAQKGQDYLSFKLSSSITKLAGEYKQAAISVIEADIRAAQYTADRVITNGEITGYEISWAEQEEVPGGDEPTGGDEPAPSGDDTDDGPIVSDANSLMAAIDAADNAVTIKLNDDFIVENSVTIPQGKTVTLDLNGQTITADSASAIVVTGGSLILENGTITGSQRALEVKNGGAAIVNDGTYITTSAG